MSVDETLLCSFQVRCAANFLSMLIILIRHSDIETCGEKAKVSVRRYEHGWSACHTDAQAEEEGRKIDGCYSEISLCIPVVRFIGLFFFNFTRLYYHRSREITRLYYHRLREILHLSKTISPAVLLTLSLLTSLRHSLVHTPSQWICSHWTISLWMIVSNSHDVYIHSFVLLCCALLLKYNSFPFALFNDMKCYTK